MGSDNMHNIDHALITLNYVEHLIRSFCGVDFTKRQTNILAFILGISIQTNKIKIHIPKLKYFEQCGVTQQKITHELEQLVEMNVLFWDRDEMTFGINANADEWKVKVYPTFIFGKCNELIELNNRLP